MDDRSLVDHDIRFEISQGMVTHTEPWLINPASLDVRMGGTIILERRPSFLARLQEWVVGTYKPLPEFDPSTDYITIDISQCTKERPYLLPPRTPALLSTIEYFCLPEDIEAQFSLKSSRAREFLNHALAGYFDPGYQGRPTLEVISYLRWHGYPLWPGKPIGHVKFKRIPQPTKSYRVTGRYNHDLTTQGSKG